MPLELAIGVFAMVFDQGYALGTLNLEYRVALVI